MDLEEAENKCLQRRTCLRKKSSIIPCEIPVRSWQSRRWLDWKSEVHSVYSLYLSSTAIWFTIRSGSDACSHHFIWCSSTPQAHTSNSVTVSQIILGTVRQCSQQGYPPSLQFTDSYTIQQVPDEPVPNKWQGQVGCSNSDKHVEKKQQLDTSCDGSCATPFKVAVSAGPNIWWKERFGRHFLPNNRNLAGRTWSREVWEKESTLKPFRRRNKVQTTFSYSRASQNSFPKILCGYLTRTFR